MLGIEDISDLQDEDEDLLIDIIELYNKGMSNRSIAKQLQHPNHHKVGKLLRKYNVPSNNKSRAMIDMVSEDEARCRYCEKVYHVSKFIGNKNVTKHGLTKKYLSTYCCKCANLKSNMRIKKDISSYLKNRMYKIKKSAKNRCLEFDLDLDYCLNQFRSQDGRCFYTDEPINWKQISGNKMDSLSFDRVDNRYGYIKGNVVFCINRINNMKNDASLWEMRKWMPNWYKRAEDFISMKNSSRLPRRPKLTFLIGPSGSGKSTWLKKNMIGIDSMSILSSDFIRRCQFPPQNQTDWCSEDAYTRGGFMSTFLVIKQQAKNLLEGGVDAVIDATNIKSRDRKSIIDYTQANTGIYDVDYIVIDRPLEDKIKSFRESGDESGRTSEDIIRKHHQTFQSSKKHALKGDGFDFINVKVVDKFI